MQVHSQRLWRPAAPSNQTPVKVHTEPCDGASPRASLGLDLKLKLSANGANRDRVSEFPALTVNMASA